MKVPVLLLEGVTVSAVTTLGILKGFGMIDWSWWRITAPVWGYLLVLTFIASIIFFYERGKQNGR